MGMFPFSSLLLFFTIVNNIVNIIVNNSFQMLSFLCACHTHWIRFYLVQHLSASPAVPGVPGSRAALVQFCPKNLAKKGNHVTTMRLRRWSGNSSHSVSKFWPRSPVFRPESPCQPSTEPIPSDFEPAGVLLCGLAHVFVNPFCSPFISAFSTLLTQLLHLYLVSIF